ncbi:patatin-like phospholipase family protein [Oscillospiraceae bacterium PP1C4]
MEKTALVLSGGGSRGAYEIGVWRALRELDERFSMVTGTSVGALNGAVVAQGSDELAERLWRELETSGVFDVDLDESLPPKKKWFSALKLFSKAAVAQGGAGTNALSKLLHSYISEDKVRRSPIDLGVVTVRMNTMKPCYIWKDNMPQGRLIDYLLASSSLFPAVRPHEIDGKKYIDGGYGDNLPIRMAIDRGATKIIAVDMEAVGVIRREKVFERYDIRTIKSYWNLGSVLLFDPNSARQNMRLGYLDTMRSYGVLDGFAYAFARGTLTDAVRKYYTKFYENIELLGFHSEAHKIIGSAAYAKIEKRVFRRGIRPSHVRGFALDGMECAAELLGMKVGTVYTLERFNARLRQAYDAVTLPDVLQDGELWQEKSAMAITAALQLAERPVRVKFLTRFIRMSIAQQRACDLLPVAALLTDEFSAALYLAEMLA